jgi:hypothetical protein
MPSNQAAYRAPSWSLLATEPLRAVLDFCSSRLIQPPLVQGDGHPVIVYPGLGAGPLTTSQLRSALKSCNFAVHDWELGVNTGPEGDFDGWIAPLVERIRELHAAEGARVSLIGWSLGGIYARELAKLCPDSVRQVITLATPFGSLDGANHAGTIYKMLGGDTSRITPELQERLRERPPVPTTSIYSKSDGMVSWEGCLQEPGPQVENVEVHASHLGMTSHPDVLRIVANRLAQPEGRWRAYRALRRSTAPSRSRK